MRLPSASAIHAARTFHSSGTSQSWSRVPVGTSVTVSGILRPTAASVARTPFP